MSRDHHDALIDQLLREMLGGDHSRDLTARVLARAKAIDRARRTWWIGAAGAIAASITIVAALWFFRPRDYPGAVVVDGGVAINTDTIDRGTIVETADDQSAKVRLGGYVNLSMAPETAMTLGGGKFEEKIIVDRGHLDIDVQKNKGDFDVSIGSATLHGGTNYSVTVAEENSPDDSDDTQLVSLKTMRIAVLDGSVDIQGLDKPVTLTKGSTQTFPVPSSRIFRFAPPVVANPSAAKPGLGSGMVAGMREANRIGSRTSPTPPSSFGPQTGRGPAAFRTLNSPNPPLFKSMQLILGDSFATGTLRRDNDVYYLEAANRNFFLFAHDPPFPNWRPILGGRIRVQWAKGKIILILPLRDFNRPGFNPAPGFQSAPAATQPGKMSPSPALIPP